MNKICAFSSDSRELYKGDIYRVLALPKDSLVHFRYEKKYVDDNLLIEPQGLKDQEVVIFYTHGNKLEQKANSLKHVSVRQAFISHAELSNDTNIFHVYMRLSEFCNIDVDSGNSEEKMPGHKFFSNLTCTKLTTADRWHDRITAIQPFFPLMTFFHLKEIVGTNSKESEKISYRNNGKSCSYSLNHGEEYTLKLAVANPSTSDTKIEISDSHDDITVNCINPFESSIRFDDQDILISVKALQVSSQNSFLKFTPLVKSVTSDKYETKGEYATFIELKLSLSYKRLFLFGLLSTLVVGSVIVGSPMSKLAEWSHWLIVALATLVFFTSSGALFYYFNKK